MVHAFEVGKEYTSNGEDVVIRVEQVHLWDGFIVIFGIETDTNNKTIRSVFGNDKFLWRLNDPVVTTQSNGIACDMCQQSPYCDGCSRFGKIYNKE